MLGIPSLSFPPRITASWCGVNSVRDKLQRESRSRGMGTTSGGTVFAVGCDESHHFLVEQLGGSLFAEGERDDLVEE